ncbi:MAG: polyprenyl synthetase family protein [Deltaproteobacteria bacterium]|nr:polyprenyl synthetase family protein [Deltaproteobacteria bacterium]MBW2672700.1 polyprenyl synthetase family protein [Deltaproteobacteria bacterium]
MEIQDVFQQYMEEMTEIETLIESRMRSYVQLIPEISDHIIKGGGKRLRPLLLVISSDLCGYGGDRRFPLASVMEFIHTASLLHDDVIDHAVIRRGKPSANSIWGNSASVLVGDYLYASSFNVLAEDGDQSIQKLLSITTSAMAEGEIIQLARCGDINTGEREYFSVIEKKTAILISAACAIGAILAKAPEVEVEALTKFGMRLGTAFQLTDDTLDYVAREDDFGKTIGMDLQEGKITLPLIRTFKKCTPEEKERIEKAVQDCGADSVQEITSLINAYGGIEYSLEKAARLVEEGKSFLEIFEDSTPKKALLAISDYVIQRKL